MLWLATYLVGESSRALSRRRRQSPAITTGEAVHRDWLDNLLTAFSTVRDRLHEYRTRRATVRELNSINERLLNDIGMTRADVERVARTMSARHARRRGSSPSAAARAESDDCCPA